MAMGRILFLTSNYPRWSGDSTPPFLHFLASDLQALGWQVTVLAPGAPNAAHQETIDSIKIVRFNYFWPLSSQVLCYEGGALGNLRANKFAALQIPFLLLCELVNVIRIQRRAPHDILHSHWLIPQGFIGVLAARTLRIPHITSAHGSDVFALRAPLFSAFKKFTLRHVDAVTANSSATVQAIEQLTDRNSIIHRIPMGAGVPDPAIIENGKKIRQQFKGPLVVYAGRLVREKGIGDLIDALARLRPEFPAIHLLLAGEGQDRSFFEAQVKKTDLDEHVTFAGWIRAEELPAWLAAGDVFTAPSWTEGQGLTVIEAMLAGTPVVASRTGGIPDAVIHEKTGLLVPPRAPEQLSEGIARLLRNPDLSERLRSNALHLAKSTFTRQASAQAFSSLYRKILKKRRRPMPPPQPTSASREEAGNFCK